VTRDPGICDTTGARCSCCGRSYYFYPPHRTAHRARTHLNALGWSWRKGDGWRCKQCRRRRSPGTLIRPTFRTPGLDKITQ